MSEISTLTQRNEASIKLYKNETSKGVISYAWEIKIEGNDITQLKKLNEQMQKEFKNNGYTTTD